MATTSPEPTRDQLEQIASDASDAAYMTRIVAILLERDNVTTPRESLPDAVLKRYEESAALAIKGSDARAFWPAVYAATENWIGRLDSPKHHLPAERVDLARAVADIVRAFSNALTGNVPADLMERCSYLAAEDLGRDPDAFIAALQEPRR